MSDPDLAAPRLHPMVLHMLDPREKARAPRPDASKRPRQQRSQQRFQTVLQVAEHLLQDAEPSQISIYSLAKAANMPPASIYHIFPDINSVYIALSEQILEKFVDQFDQPPSGEFSTWQELMAIRFAEARQYYNANKPARNLILGSGYSGEIRSRDLHINRKLAQRSLDELQRYFHQPESPDLVERFVELIAISDTLWALSVHRNGLITDAGEEQARRAREAYARTFLPEYLTRR